MNPLDPRYVTRPVDLLLEKAIQSGESAILLIKGPRETGKSSLVIRQLHEAQRLGALTILTDFKAFSQNTFNTTADLCVTIAMQVAQQIQVAQQLQPRGTTTTGTDGSEDLLTPEEESRIRKIPAIGLEQFIQRRVLNQNPETKILWVMDRVDRLFGTSCGQDFFSLLRSWHDKRAQLSFRSWRRFQIGLVSSTESTLFLRNVNQSPFNVGLHIDVGDFTLDEVKVLNQRYGEPMEPAQVAALYELLAGHPTLTSRSLELVNSNQSFHTLQCFNALLMEAHHEGGPFGEHLARMWEMLQVVPELLEAVRSALLGKPCPEQAFLRLRSAGVLSGPSSDRAKVRCLLYARYLESKILP